MNRRAAIVSVLAGSLGGAPTFGENPAFQDYFFEVCASGPGGQLAVRCGETLGGAGDLSSDSESSLNPGQTLSSTDGALAHARARSKQARERVERYRGEAEGGETRISLGPVSLLVNARMESEERERQVDVDAERGYRSDRRAVELGLDRRFSDAFVGGLLYGYEDNELEFDREAPAEAFRPAVDAGTIDREAHSLTLFGVWRVSERVYLEANAGYADSEYELERRAVFQESRREVPQTAVTARGESSGDQLWLGLTIGYDWQHGAASYGLYGGTTYAKSRVDGYREVDPRNTGLALVVDDVSREALNSHLGLRAQRAFGTSSAVWVPQLRVEYEHAGGTEDARSEVRFDQGADASTFRLTGDGGDDWLNLAVGMAAIFPNGWISFVDLEGMAGAEDRERYRVTIGLRKEL